MTPQGTTPNGTTALDVHAAHRARLEALGLTPDEARRLQEADLTATEALVDLVIDTLGDRILDLTDDDLTATIAELVVS